MQGHGIGDVEADGLRYDPAALGDFGGGKPILARQRIERRLEHVTAGGRAHAGVEPDRRLLLHGVLARLGVSAIELAAEQRAEMRGFEFFVELGVLGDDLADARQDADRRDDLGDRLIQRRLDHRPSRRENAARPVVEAVHLEAGLEGLHEIGLCHREKSHPLDGRMVCENRCCCVNELVTNRASPSPE